jgi:cation diffusion facilitator CzcD-associated flavoprotein CzcO
MSLHTPTLIIGAGPAGLAVAGRLRKLGLDFEVVEQSNQIAHSWQN